MGIIINFPEVQQVSREAAADLVQSATIMILPVIRIERDLEGPHDGYEPVSESGGRKRRRRARRS
jgi:hypothetical protein